MTYRLRLDPALHATYKALPDEARRDLSVCLLDALEDPLAHSEPYGIDDGITRQLVLDDTIAILLVTAAMKRVRILQINYLG